MTAKGRWGTFINGKNYQQALFDTHKGLEKLYGLTKRCTATPNSRGA